MIENADGVFSRCHGVMHDNDASVYTIGDMWSVSEI